MAKIFKGTTFFILNLLFILIIAIISFELARVILTMIGLDETTVIIGSLPVAIFISSLIFITIGRLIRRGFNEIEDEAITGTVSEIAEMKGKNGLTYFKFKVNGRIYELPLLPETYFLLDLRAGEKVIIPLTQEVRRYIST